MSAETWAERRERRHWGALYEGKPQPPHDWDVVRDAAQRTTDPLLASLLRSVAEEWWDWARFNNPHSQRYVPLEMLKRRYPVWHDALMLAEQILAEPSE